MPATKQDRAGLSEKIEAHAKRLHLLEVQAARMGNDTPPHITAEIEQIDAELAQLKQAAAIRISDEFVEDLGATGRYQLWMSHVMRLDMDIGHARREIGQLAARVEALHEKFDQLLLALAVEPRQARNRTVK